MARRKPIPGEGFDGFQFQRQLTGDFAPVGSTFVQGEAKLAGPSNALIRVDFPLNTEAPGPRAATFQVEITDVNQQTIGRSVRFQRDSSDFYLGIREPAGVIGAGKPLEVEIAAIGRKGKPWTRREQATLVLRRVDWESVLVQGAGNSVRYRHKAILTNVWEKEIEVEPPLRMEIGGEVTHRGTKIEGILAPGAGEYYLDVSSKDASGRAVASSVRFHVAENTRTAWDYRNEYEIKLVPNRTVYHPGEAVDRELQKFGLARLSPTDFLHADHQAILRLLQESIAQDMAEPLQYVMNNLSLPMMEVADDLLARTEKLDPNDERVLSDLLRALLDLRSRNLRQDIEYLRHLMEDAQGQGDRSAEQYGQAIVQHAIALQRLDQARGHHTSRALHSR